MTDFEMFWNVKRKKQNKTNQTNKQKTRKTKQNNNPTQGIKDRHNFFSTRFGR